MPELSQERSLDVLERSGATVVPSDAAIDLPDRTTRREQRVGGIEQNCINRHLRIITRSVMPIF
jgi:hypothetical protein